MEYFHIKNRRKTLTQEEFEQNDGKTKYNYRIPTKQLK